jgi:hypothetical protein
VEAAINCLLVLMAKADDEAVRILINELEYSRRVKTADVLFAWFIDAHRTNLSEEKQVFHRLMVELLRLGERRNEMVHSVYYEWTDVTGSPGLLRMHSKLSGGAGKREESEEELLHKAFTEDLRKLNAVARELEAYRLRIIEALYPDDTA